MFQSTGNGIGNDVDMLSRADSNISNNNENTSNERTPITEYSVNQLQHVGPLHSEPENLSLPIHNEARFDDQTQSDDNREKSSNQFSKVAAETINREDETCDSDGTSTKQLASSTEIPAMIVGSTPTKIDDTDAKGNVLTESILSPIKNVVDGSSSIEKRPSKQLKRKNLSLSLTR